MIGRAPQAARPPIVSHTRCPLNVQVAFTPALQSTQNALAQNDGPRTAMDVELATLGWVHWWNHQRLLEPIGNIPPVEFEQQLDGTHNTPIKLSTTTPSPASSHNHEVAHQGRGAPLAVPCVSSGSQGFVQRRGSWWRATA